MSRVIELVVAASLLVMNLGSPAEPRPDAAPVDVGELLAAAHGAPPIICALAARSVQNGWGEGGAAPVTPLPMVEIGRDGDGRWRPFSTADEDRLLAGLASDDACVRELSVRLLGGQGTPRVAGALVTRLGSPDTSLRAVAGECCRSVD
jgi:hypothetical protein